MSISELKLAGYSLSELGHAANMGILDINEYTPVDKFGYLPPITTDNDPVSLWEGQRIYTFDPNGTAPITSIASTSASDAMEIVIEGLDINGSFARQTKTLQGTTRLALDTPLWRCYRMYNNGSTDIVGNVFVYTGTGAVPTEVTDSRARALIIDGNNQTQMAIYTVPRGKVGFLFRGEVGMQYSGSVGTGTQFLRASYRSRRYGKVFRIQKTITLINAASSEYQDKRPFPDIIPDLTDIEIRVDEVSATMGAWAALDILLVDENELPKAYLQQIGQQSAAS